MTSKPTKQQQISSIMKDDTLTQKEKMALIHSVMLGSFSSASSSGSSLFESNSPSSIADITPTEQELAPEYQSPGILGCKHYQRKCKIVANCCKKLFVCRLCHDDAFSTKNHHTIDRKATKFVLCMECQKIGPISKNCVHCNVEFASTFCDICRMWANRSCMVGDIMTIPEYIDSNNSMSPSLNSMSQKTSKDENFPINITPINGSEKEAFDSQFQDPQQSIVSEQPHLPQAQKSKKIRSQEYIKVAQTIPLPEGKLRFIFHCHECGICRIGRGIGISHFHCPGCGLDFCLSQKPFHKQCQTKELFCSICHEDLFSSTSSTEFLECRHPIHSKCKQNAIKHFFLTGQHLPRCPLCKKLYIDITPNFIYTELHAALQKMPKKISAIVLCNECHKQSETQFHFISAQCNHCGTHNVDILTKKIVPDSFEFPMPFKRPFRETTLIMLELMSNITSPPILDLFQSETCPFQPTILYEKSFKICKDIIKIGSEQGLTTHQMMKKAIEKYPILGGMDSISDSDEETLNTDPIGVVADEPIAMSSNEENDNSTTPILNNDSFPSSSSSTSHQNQDE